MKTSDELHRVHAVTAALLGVLFFFIIVGVFGLPFAIGFSGAKHPRTDGKHEDSAAPNSMVPGNLWRIAGYFRSLRDSLPTANEMGKLVFDAEQGRVWHLRRG
jgi:hypothetical protein